MGTGKRLFDIVCSSAGLIVLSPLLVVVAALVKLGDGGPVFFLHERVGRGFRPFNVIKFRTMVTDAPGRGLSITRGGDPRITRLGAYLRKSKLDELPQLVNVLKGEMSLVGPRPEVMKYVEAFREDFDEVLKVRPGITDYASIMFRDEEEVLRQSDDPETMYINSVLPKKLGLNKHYIRNAGVFEDVKILFRTLLSL